MKETQINVYSDGYIVQSNDIEEFIKIAMMLQEEMCKEYEIVNQVQDSIIMEQRKVE